MSGIRIIFVLHVVTLLLWSDYLWALRYVIPRHGDLIGEMQFDTVRTGESLGDIGRRFDIGLYEMIEANPKLDPWAPEVGAKVVIPTAFILPKDRSGAVLNLAEMRLYYFHRSGHIVSTFPVGIGRKNWITPLGDAKVVQKIEDPIWYPPDSIRREHAKNGDILPKFVLPGPDNPLGKYALRLSMEGYLIHGTNRPGGIGVRSSSGCIRLSPNDIAELYKVIPVGERVRIIHEPYKIGWQDNQLYLEAHEPLSDNYYKSNYEEKIIYAIQTQLQEPVHTVLSKARDLIIRASGYPMPLK